MTRVKRGVAAHKKKRKIFKLAKGYRMNKSKLYKFAKEQVEKGLQYAYRDRKKKKSDMRGLWIIRINAACRNNGLSYSRFISGLKKANVMVDRKIMAEIAVKDEAGFTKLVEAAKAHLVVQ